MKNLKIVLFMCVICAFMVSCDPLRPDGGTSGSGDGKSENFSLEGSGGN